MPKPTRPQRPLLALLSIVTLAVLAAIALVPATGGSKANAEPLLSGDPSFSQPQFSEAPSDEPTPPQEQCQASDFAGPPLPAGSLTISGTVTDAANAVGQGGIRVRILGPGNTTGDVYTGADGTYAMPLLGDGSYQVSFYDNSGQYKSVFYDAGSLTLSPPAAPSVVLAGSDSLPIDAALPAEELADISGLITDNQALAFTGAKLTANGRYFPMSGCATSQGDGTYAMTGVRAGVYRVQVVDPSAQNPTGYYSADVAGGWVGSASSATDVIADGTNIAAIDIQFPPIFTLSGSVRDGDSLAVADIYVSACPVGGGGCRSAVSDVDGLFVVDGVVADDYLVQETGSGYLNGYYGPGGFVSNEADATVVEVTGNVTGINLLAVAAPRVSGIVTNSGASPVDGIAVGLENVDTGDSVPVVTAGGGFYSIPAQPGTYRVFVLDTAYPPVYPAGYLDADGGLVFGPADAEQLVVGSTDLNLDLQLPDGGTLDVSVVMDGNPVPYSFVQVCLTETQCGVGSLVWDEFGNVSFPALLPGDYTVNVVIEATFWYVFEGVATEDAGLATPVTVGAPGTTSIEVILPTPGTPTPEGTNVPVPLDDGSNTNPVNLTFGAVTGSGTTSLTIPETPPDVPSGFQVGDPPTYYDIVTTATFSGSVKICVSFDPAAYLDPAGVRLLHFVEAAEPQWQDITQLPVDDVNGVVCGFTTSFSPFLLAERTYDFQGFFGIKEPPHINDRKAGDAIGVQFSLGGDVGLTIFADGSPTWQLADCSSGAAIGDPNIAQAAAALKFNAHTGRYTVSWKTDKSWKRSCRLLTLTFRDGTAASALFRFLK